MEHFIPALLLLLMLALPVFAEQSEQSFRQTVTRELSLRYLISFPNDYDPEGEPIPLLIFLHGAGERGDDLDKVKSHGPAKMLKQGHAFPAIVIAPQCPAQTWWPEHLETLSLLLDDLIATHNVDTDRIYLTGLSMGGYGTWSWAGREPERFAAIIPICGGGEYWHARQLGESGTRVWAFHGEADSVVPVEESKRMTDLLRLKGADDVKLTTYPEVGHDSWTQTYDNPEVWQWMFAQRRGSGADD